MEKQHTRNGDNLASHQSCGYMAFVSDSGFRTHVALLMHSSIAGSGKSMLM